MRYFGKCFYGPYLKHTGKTRMPYVSESRNLHKRQGTRTRKK